MKKSEKILLLILTVLFFCIYFFGDEFATPFFIVVLILSICYFIGGFYFFSSQKGIGKNNIVAGIILGASLSTISLSSSIPVSVFIKIIVSINLLFLVILIGLWIYKKDNFKNNLKYILYRSLTIALFTSFFSFSSIRSDVYRNTLKRMENPESSLYKNFLMFDKIMEYERFMENKKYPEAIIAAEQSIIYGKEWKGYDTLYYEDFSGTFEKLADAYVKNGDSLYTKRDYNTALINYLQADSILTHKEHIPKYPKATESDIYWNRYNLLLTYNKLSDNKNYDLEVDYLANNYSKVKDTVDLDYYYIMKNVGNNYYERSWFSESILINKSSLKVLSRDSLNNIDEYRNTYIQLIKNYLTTDSLNNTRKYLNEFKKIALIDDCLYLFYNTSLLQRENIKEALGSAKKTLECFEQGNNYNNIFEANLILAIIELENSNYSNFEDQIINAHKLVYKTTNRDYKQAKLDQVSAYYNQILGNYKESKSSYYKALDYYKNSDDPNQLAIELKIAQINDDLNINYNKENINEQALNFLSEYEIVLPSFTSIYNDLGNINIGFDLKLSDSLFNVTISSHNDYGIEYTSALGVAYNGLGANKLDQKDYKKADSLFNIALIQLDKFYEKNQNFNQIINQLNLAESKFHQKDFLSSKYYLNEAILTKNNCFKNKVTIYDAYILNLEGDILKNSLHNSEESLQKYILALDIAKKHFDENHRFIINLQRKLKL